MDELIKVADEYHNRLDITAVPLNFDKEIYLLRAFEEDHEVKKKYIRNAGILVKDFLLASTFSDTVHFMEELFLFDIGNDQNKYLTIAEHQKTKNLKLKIDGENSIYISKSEARAIYKLFNLSMMGYSISRVLEHEYRFTPQHLTRLLYDNKYFRK